MMLKHSRKHPHAGQGLVEYAVILALVAIGSIIILTLAGVSVQRLYGVVAGSLGAKQNAEGAQVIEITGADCYVIAVGSSYAGGVFRATGYTGYFIKVNSNVPVDQLNSAGTELSQMMTLYMPQTTIVPPPGISNYTFQKDVVPYPDASKCPRSVNVQSSRGVIAVSPMNIQQIP